MMYVVVYNALARARTEVTPLPVDSRSIYVVERLHPGMTTWSAVESELIPNHNYAKAHGAAQFTLYFNASNLPPLGAAIYRISNPLTNVDATPAVARNLLETRSMHLASTESSTSQTMEDLILSNGHLSVTIDR